MSKYLIQYVFVNKSGQCCVNMFYDACYDDLMDVVRMINAHADNSILMLGVHKWILYSIGDNAASYTVLHTVIKEVNND